MQKQDTDPILIDQIELRADSKTEMSAMGPIPSFLQLTINA